MGFWKTLALAIAEDEEMEQDAPYSDEKTNNPPPVDFETLSTLVRDAVVFPEDSDEIAE